MRRRRGGNKVDREKIFFNAQGRLGWPAKRLRSRRAVSARHRPQLVDFPHDPQEARPEPEGPDLRLGAADFGNATLLQMLGIPVLQGYGLTETTAICTMDDPRKVEPGTVGPAIPGIEMKLGASEEILVRGPNIFPGYWNRPQETAKGPRAADGFTPATRGSRTAAGNWRIIGRLKNLLILSSGHNVAPEPLEEKLVRTIPGAQQVVVFGHGRSYLAALVTGDVDQGPRRGSPSNLSTRACPITASVHALPHRAPAADHRERLAHGQREVAPRCHRRAFSREQIEPCTLDESAKAERRRAAGQS